MPDNGNRKLLYDKISDKIGNLGTYEEFNKRLDDPNNVKLLYDKISDKLGNIGTYEEFGSRIGIKKKDLSISAIPAPVSGENLLKPVGTSGDVFQQQIRTTKPTGEVQKTQAEEQGLLESAFPIVSGLIRNIKGANENLSGLGLTDKEIDKSNSSNVVKIIKKSAGRAINAAANVIDIHKEYGSKIASGAVSAISGLSKAPEMALSIAKSAERSLPDWIPTDDKLHKALGLDKLPQIAQLSPLNPIKSVLTGVDMILNESGTKDYLNQKSDAINKYVYEQDQKIYGDTGLKKLFEEGEYGLAARKLGGEASYAAPVIVGTIYGGPEVLAASSLSVGGNRYRELQATEYDNISPEAKSLDIVVHMGADYTLNKVGGSGLIARSFKKVAAGEITKVAAREVIEKEISSTFTNYAKKILGVTTPIMSPIYNGLSSAGIQLSKNIVDKELIDPSIDLMHGVNEAGINGLGVGLVYSGVSKLSGTIKDINTRNKVKGLEEQANSLKNDLESDNITEAQRNLIQKKLSSNIDDITELSKKDDIEAKKLSEKEIKDIYDQNKRIEDIDGLLKNEKISESTKKDFEAEKQEVIKKQEEHATKIREQQESNQPEHIRADEEQQRLEENRINEEGAVERPEGETGRGDSLLEGEGKVTESSPVKDKLSDLLTSKERVAKEAKLAEKKGKMGFWTKMDKAFMENQPTVLKMLKKTDPTGVTEAYFRNVKGSSGRAAAFLMDKTNSIFGGFKSKKNIDIDGVKTSERDLLDNVITLRRIADIDSKMETKFNELNNNNTSPELKQKAIEYLEQNKVFKKNEDGSYELLQFKHPSSFTGKEALESLNKIKETNPELFAKLNEKADEYSNSFKGLLKEKLDAGLISEDSYNALNEGFYAPRKFSDFLLENVVTEDFTRTVHGRKIVSNIKKLAGGKEGDISQHYQELLDMATASDFRKIMENESVKKISGLTGKENSPFLEPKYETDSKGNVKILPAPEGHTYIDYFDKGVSKKVAVPNEFAKEYNRVDEVTLNPTVQKVLDNLRKYTGVELFRSALTGYNPGFGAFQITKDAPQALFSTQAYNDMILGSGLLAKDYASAVKVLLNKKSSPMFKEAADAGVFSEMQSKRDDVLGLRNKRVDSFIGKTAKNASIFNENVEYMTRLSVFMRSKKVLTEKFVSEKGRQPSPTEIKDINALAATESRGVVDFARGGDYAKIINNISPYFNARLRGFKSLGLAAKKNPTKFAFKAGEVAILGSLLTMYSKGAFERDPEKKKQMEEDYNALSNTQKTNYFNIRNPFTDNPDYKFAKIPKPEILIPIIESMDQVYENKMHGKEMNHKKIINTLDNLSPINLASLTSNPLLNSFIKYNFNKDPYSKQDIVKNEQDIPDYLEYKKSTPELYKKIGEVTSGIGEGVSPERLKGAVESFIGKPEKNPFLSLPITAAGAIMGNDDESERKTLGADVLDYLSTGLGVKSRLFNKTGDFDNDALDLLDDRKKATYIKKFNINQDLGELLKTKDKESIDNAKSYLKDLIQDDVLDESEASRMFSAMLNKPDLNNLPSWYKTVFYMPDSESKAYIVYDKVKDKSDKEIDSIFRDLIKNKIVSPKIYYNVIKIKKENGKK